MKLNLYSRFYNLERDGRGGIRTPGHSAPSRLEIVWEIQTKVSYQARPPSLLKNVSNPYTLHRKIIPT